MTSPAVFAIAGIFTVLCLLIWALDIWSDRSGELTGWAVVMTAVAAGMWWAALDGSAR